MSIGICIDSPKSLNGLSLTRPREVSVPALDPVSLSFGLDCLGAALDSVNSASDNDNVATRVVHDFSRCAVLLAHSISCRAQTDTWSEDQKVFDVVDAASCAQGNPVFNSALSDKTNDEVLACVASHLYSAIGVATSGKGALG